MSRARRHGWIAVLAVAVPLACHQHTPPVAGSQPALQGPPPLPAKARLPLAEVPPSVARPGDAAGADKVPDAARQAVEQCERLLAEREFAKAVAALDRASRDAPDSPRVLRALGLAYAGVNNHVKAEEFLKRSAEKAPDHIAVQLLLGRYAVSRGDLESARQHFRRGLLCSDAAGDSPDTAETLVRLATVLENQGYWTAALECHRRLGEILTQPPRSFEQRPLLRVLAERPERLLLARGRLRLQLRQHDQAAKLLERAYRRDKTHRQAAELAVSALLASGRFERVEAIVLELLEQPRLSDVAVDAAVRLCRAQKDPDVPRRLVKAYLDRGGSSSPFVVAMAEAAAELGAVDAATEMLHRRLATAPDDTATAIRLAGLEAQRGELPAAAKLLADLLAGERIGVQQLRRECRRLARKPIDRAAIEKLPDAAPAQPPKLAPAMTVVAGMLAEASGHLDLAERLLTGAVAGHPSFWAGYEALAHFQVDRGDLAALDDLAEKIDRFGGDSYLKYYLLGKIRLDQWRVEKAVELLEEARSRRGGHVPTLLLLGRAYARKSSHRDDQRDAERRLLAAMALAPRDADAATELFELYLSRRQTTEAGRVVERFLRDNAGSAPGQLLAARYYLYARQPDRARRLVEKVLADEPENVDGLLLRLRMELPGSFPGKPLPADRAETALREARRILRLSPHSIPAHRLLAQILANQKRHAQAAAALEGLYRRRSQEDAVARPYLDALIDAGKKETVAEEVAKIGARRHLGTPMKLVAVGAAERIERFELAEKLLETWLKDPLDNAELSRLRARALRLYETAKHFDKALALLEEWVASGLESDPAGRDQLHIQRMRIHALAGDIEAAEKLADKLKFEDQKQLHPREVLVTVLIEAKAFAKAREVLEKRAAGKQARPDLISLLRASLMRAMRQAEQFDALAEYARARLAAEPAEHELIRFALALLGDAEQHDRAVALAEHWREFAEKQPGPTTTPTTASAGPTPVERARRAFVEVLLQADRKKEALRRAREYHRQDPGSVAAMRALLAALHALERETEALELMERIYRLDEDDPGINNDLGYSWADRGIHLRQAEFMIRKALGSQPKTIAFQDSLGWVLYKQGKLEAAARVFERACAADVEELHPIILDHAGDTAWRMGRKEQAIRYWMRAIELAEEETSKDRETKQVLSDTPRKITEARKARGRPKVAPLGKGVPEPKR